MVYDTGMIGIPVKIPKITLEEFKEYELKLNQKGLTWIL